MGYFFNTSDINQTFIIEPLSITGGSPTLTACTALYTNAVVSCSGDTQIFMGNGVITFDGNLYTNNDLTANVINASTYYSGGTNLLDLISSENITGGTFNNNTDTLSIYKSNGSIISVTGFTDYYTTGATLIGTTAYFNRNDRLSAYTLNLSTFTADTFVTGVTFSNNQLIIVKNDGTNVSTFINTFTGLTVNGLLKSNSISATTISATTFYGDGSHLTGLLTFTGTTNQLPKFTSPNSIGDSTIKDFGTHVSANNTAIGQWVNTNYAQFGHLNVFSPTIQTNYAILQSSAGETFLNSTGRLHFRQMNNEVAAFNGGNFLIGYADAASTIYKLDVNGDVNFAGTVTTTGLSSNTISATTYYGLPQDIYVTGSSFDVSSKTLTNTRNDNTNIDVILPVRTFLTAETTTTNNTLQTIDTITGITDNSNVFIISYLNAYKDSVDYGFWKRTLAINKVSGLVSIIGENSDFDRVSSGMTANSVIYSANSGDISISVSGETAKSYTWKSNWEIIK